MKKLIVLFLLFASITVSALPTPPKTQFLWTQSIDYTDGSPMTAAANTLYCGGSPGGYTITYNLPAPAESVLIADALPDGGPYYCAVTVSDAAGLESEYSNELGPFMLVNGAIPVLAPSAPGNLRAQ